MYYRLNSKRPVPAFYRIKLPSGRMYSWPKGCWHEAPNEEVAKYIEQQLALGNGKWERQSTDVKEPEEVKVRKTKKAKKKNILDVELPPEPEDAPIVTEEPAEEQEPEAEEEDDFMG